MKRLLIIAIALISIQGIAQQQGTQRANRVDRAQRMSDLTPEEAATLQTKKMTLHLDLNESQQKQIQKINLENAIVRKSMMESFKEKKENGSIEKPSKEARLQMMNTRLDRQIAMKAKMKTILNKEQFDKWEKEQGTMQQRTVGMRKNDNQRKGNSAKKQ